MVPESMPLRDVPFAVVSSFGGARGRDRVAVRLCEHLRRVGAQVTALVDGDEVGSNVPGEIEAEPLPPGEELGAWIDRNKVEALLFVEFPAGGEPEQWARWSEAANRFVYTAWERIDRHLLGQLRHFDGVIAAHNAFATRLREFDIPSLPFSWGWNPPHPKPRLSDDDPISLLHVGGSGEGWCRKATDKVIEAFRELAKDSRFRCRLTSPEPLEEALADELEQAGVQIDIGQLPAPRIEALHRAARVAIFPSRWEGIGLPILEALSAGTPVVTTDGAPMNEWVRNRREGLFVPSVEGTQEGVAVPTREIEASDLVQTVTSLADDRELLAALEKKALQGGSTRLTSTAAAEQFANAVSELLKV